MGEEPADAVGVGSRCHLVDAKILLQKQLAQDIHRIRTAFVDHLAQHPRLPAQVLGPAERAEPDVPQAALAGKELPAFLQFRANTPADRWIGETLPGLHRAPGLRPHRDQDQQSRAGPLVGVGIERHVEALRPRVVDQLEHRIGSAGECQAVVEVRDVGGRLAPPADLDRLAKGVQVAVAQRVAHVGVVEASVPAGFARELRQLPGGGIAAGRIVEARAQAERALLHPLAQQRPLAIHRPLVDRHIVPSDCRDPERRVADHERDVDADLPIEARQIARDRVPVVGQSRPAIEAAIEMDE